MRGAERGGASVRWKPRPYSPPLPARLTGLGHLPQPMNVFQGGPWNQRLQLLRVVVSAVGNQNPVGTVQVDQPPQPAWTQTHRHLTSPSAAPHHSARAERSRSPTRRPGPTCLHCLRSTHGDQQTLKEFGVSGAGQSLVRKGRFLCLGDVFSSTVWTLCLVGGRWFGG